MNIFDVSLWLTFVVTFQCLFIKIGTISLLYAFYIYKAIIAHISTRQHPKMVRQTQPGAHGDSNAFYEVWIISRLHGHGTAHDALNFIHGNFRSISSGSHFYGSCYVLSHQFFNTFKASIQSPSFFLHIYAG